MKRIKILLKKVNKIVENIDTDELIKSIELDEKEEQEYDIKLNEIKIDFSDNNMQYVLRNKIRYSMYKEYNDYDMEEYIWTSIKAS